MTTNRFQPLGAPAGDAVVAGRGRSLTARPDAERVSDAASPEAMQRSGKRMIVAGFAITIVGVVLYCAASFAGGLDAYLGRVLFDNAVSFVRVTLVILGLGTLVWLVGSFTYLRGAMDAEVDDDASDAKGPADGPARRGR